MFHTMSLEDREMFAYNKQQEQIQRHLDHPENRIRYAIDFLNQYVNEGDSEMIKKCYDGIAKYSEQLDWSESHF